MAWTAIPTQMIDTVLATSYWNSAIRDNLSHLKNYSLRRLSASDWHLEASGYGAFGASQAAPWGNIPTDTVAYYSVTFEEAFDAAPYVVCAPTYAQADGGEKSYMLQASALSISPTGFTAALYNNTGPGVNSPAADWLIYGQG